MVSGTGSLLSSRRELVKRVAYLGGGATPPPLGFRSCVIGPSSISSIRGRSCSSVSLENGVECGDCPIGSSSSGRWIDFPLWYCVAGSANLTVCFPTLPVVLHSTPWCLGRKIHLWVLVMHNECCQGLYSLLMLPEAVKYLLNGWFSIVRVLRIHWVADLMIRDLLVHSWP